MNRCTQTRGISFQRLNVVPKIKPTLTKGKWTEVEDTKLMELYRSGFSYKGIASIMGRSIASIDSRLRDMRKSKIKLIELV